MRRPRALRPRALVVHLLVVAAAVFGGPSAAAWSAGTGLSSEGPKLTGATASGFGAATALSADGATALVGSPGDDSVRVMSRADGTWTTEATLTPSDADGAAGFGAAVALSADGTVALVGGPADAGETGAAWIFVGDGTTWTQAGTKLTAADEIGSGRLGASVALSGSGGVAVVGGPSDGGSAGGVWVASRSGGAWTPLGARLAPSGASGSGRFGSAVAVSGDGTEVVAGAPDENASAGAIWTFTPGGDGTFTQTGTKITAGTTGLGTSLAIDATGATVLAGAPGDAGGAGVGIVFALSGGSYIESAVLAPSVDGLPALGTSVALSSDGSVALIGGPGGPLATGAAWSFTRSGATWLDRIELDPLDAVDAARAGSAIALAADGHTALVGGPGDHASAGAVWPFAEAPVVASVAPALGDAAGGAVVTITGTGLGAARAVRFGGDAAASFIVDGPTQISAVAPPAASVGTVDITVDTSAGTSLTSSADTFAYATVPGAPGSPAATAAEDTVTVSFAAPADDGATPVQGYEIAVSPGATTVSTTGTQAVIGGLTNGTTYTLTVRARNAIGLGAAATASAMPQPGPLVSAISTKFGPVAGGTVVTITGVRLTGAIGVSFGGTASTHVAVVSDTQITATAPPHAAAAVDVIVQGPHEASPASCADAFAFVPANGLPLPAHGCAIAFPLQTAGPGGGAPQAVTLSVPDGGSATLLDAGGNAATVVTTAAGRFELSGAVVTYSPKTAFVGAGAVTYRLEGDGGSTSTSTYSTAITKPPPPVAPPLTSIGEPGVTQQKAIGVVAGERMVLLDAAGRPAPTGTILVSGEGRYTLGGSATVLFQPDAAFRGKAHGIRYRLTDEYGQSATGTYTPTVAGGSSGSGGAGGTGGGSGGSGGSGPDGSTPTPSVRLTTATLNIATASGVVAIGCGLSTGLIADCRVALVATVSGHRVTIGTGVDSPDTAAANVVVRVALTARGRELSRRLGGVAVRAEGSVAVAGLPGRVAAAVALHAVAQTFLLPHSVRFATRSAKLSPSERRSLTSLARSLRGVRRIDCIGAARDVRKGSRRTSLARSRARTACAYLKARLPRTTMVAPRAERTGDRRGTTRHADLVVRY